MTERNDTETQSYREAQGKPPEPGSGERLGDVPLAPSSGGGAGAPRGRDESSADTDRDDTGRATAHADDAERGEVF